MPVMDRKSVRLCNHIHCPKGGSSQRPNSFIMPDRNGERTEESHPFIPRGALKKRKGSRRFFSVAWALCLLRDCRESTMQRTVLL
jgi:hypothetical protein